MAQEVFVTQKPVVDFDDKVGQVSAPITGVETKIVFQDTQATFFRTRTGRRARLVGVANAVDSGGETNVTFHVYANGARLRSPYDAFKQAMGETYRGDTRMAVPIDIPQNALVEVTVENADVGTAYNAFVRIRVEYEDY